MNAMQDALYLADTFVLRDKIFQAAFHLEPKDSQKHNLLVALFQSKWQILDGRELTVILRQWAGLLTAENPWLGQPWNNDRWSDKTHLNNDNNDSATAIGSRQHKRASTNI